MTAAPAATPPAAPAPGTLDRALRALDIQPRPFRALLSCLILMDLRGFHYGKATGTGPNAVVSPLYWVVGQFLTVSLLLSAALYARVDAAFFAFAGLATAAVLMLSAVVVELNEAALDARDALIVGHRPLHPRTYAAARMVNLLFYVALLGTSLTIFPAVVGAGLRDAGPWYLPAYVFASALVNVGVAAAVLLLLTSLGAGPALDSARAILAWTQIVLILVVFYGAQLMLRQATGGVELFAARPPAWLTALPLHALGRWVAEVAAAPRPEHLGQAAAALGLVLALVGAAVLRLSRAYAGAHAGARAWRRVHAPRPPAPGTLQGTLLQWICPDRQQGAAFWLVRAHLRRDPELAMRTWPTLATALAALLLGALTDQLADPLAGGDPTKAVLPLAVAALLASAVPVAVQNLAFSRDPQASSLLATAPLRDPAAFLAGVRKALLASVFAPAVLALAVTLAVLWRDPLHALVHAALTWVLIDGAARVSVPAVLRGLPFAQPMVRGATLGGIALVSAAVFAAASTAGAAYLFAARAGSPGLLGAGLLLGFALALTERWSAARARELLEGRRAAH